MKLVQSALARWPDYARLEQAVEGGGRPRGGDGALWGAQVLRDSLPVQKDGRRALVLAADEAEAQRFCEDLAALGLRPVSYPLRDFNFRDTAGTSHEYERLRLDGPLQAGGRPVRLHCGLHGRRFAVHLGAVRSWSGNCSRCGPGTSWRLPICWRRWSSAATPGRTR